jgi:hypothetical protein
VTGLPSNILCILYSTILPFKIQFCIIRVNSIEKNMISNACTFANKNQQKTNVFQKVCLKFFWSTESKAYDFFLHIIFLFSVEKSYFFHELDQYFSISFFRPSRFHLLCPFVVVSFPLPYNAIECGLWWDLMRRRGIPGWVLCPSLQNGWSCSRLVIVLVFVYIMWCGLRSFMVVVEFSHFSCCSCSCFSFNHAIRSCGGYTEPKL